MADAAELTSPAAHDETAESELGPLLLAVPRD
jgi:hypothetical protein